MTKNELKEYNQHEISFAIGGERGLGVLNYIRGDDRFQILYHKQDLEAHSHSRATFDLTDEMVEAIIKRDDKLVLHYPSRGK